MLHLTDGWLRDTHPPAFNVWATLLSSLGITVDSRCARGIELAGGGTDGLGRRRGCPAPTRRQAFPCGHAAVVLALPQSVVDFANYRSYFWQIAALASLVAIARHVVTTTADLEVGRDHGLVIVTVLATAGSIALHYVGAIFGGLLAGAIILRALQRGHWRWATLIFGVASSAALFVVAIALLQAGHWAVDLDHSWIEARPLAAVLAVPLALIAGAVANNVVSLAALWPGWRRWSPSERIFVVLIAAVLAIALLVILAINAVQPIMVDRYLVAVPVLMGGILAALAAKLDRDHRLHLLLALVAVGMAAGPLLLQGAKPLWEEGAPVDRADRQSLSDDANLCRQRLGIGAGRQHEGGAARGSGLPACLSDAGPHPRLHGAFPRTERSRTRSPRQMPGARLVRAYAELCRGRFARGD